MTDFITKDNKVIPINNSKNNLSSKQLGIGNDRLTRKDEKVESLMSTKQGAFPLTNTKVGIQKGWSETEYLKAQKILFEIVERETGHRLTDGGFSVTDTINGEEIKSGFQIVPLSKKGSNYSSAPFVYTGFRINLPKEALNNFNRLDKFKEENPDLEVKSDGHGYSFVQYFTVPATNPSKINLIAPLLNEIVEMGITGKAELTLHEAEQKEKKENRVTKIKSIHQTLMSDLKREGFEQSSYDLKQEPYVSDDTFRQSVRSEVEVTPDSILKGFEEGKKANRTFVKVRSQIEDNDGEITFSLDNQFRLNETQLIKMLKILKEG